MPRTDVVLGAALKNSYDLFMNDTDRESFLQYCSTIGLVLVGNSLRFSDSLTADEVAPTANAASQWIGFNESRRYNDLLTCGGIALPKAVSRDKSEKVKRTKLAYRKLIKWIQTHFSDDLNEVFQNGDRRETERHWLGPNTRCSVESGAIELCEGTNSSSRFALRRNPCGITIR